MLGLFSGLLEEYIRKFPIVVMILNDLPCDIKTAPTLNTFKSRYDEYVKNF